MADEQEYGANGEEQYMESGMEGMGEQQLMEGGVNENGDPTPGDKINASKNDDDDRLVYRHRVVIIFRSPFWFFISQIFNTLFAL